MSSGRMRGFDGLSGAIAARSLHHRGFSDIVIDTRVTSQPDEVLP